jgi:hypothetical protein
MMMMVMLRSWQTASDYEVAQWQVLEPPPVMADGCSTPRTIDGT